MFRNKEKTFKCGVCGTHDHFTDEDAASNHGWKLGVGSNTCPSCEEKAVETCRKAAWTYPYPPNTTRADAADGMLRQQDNLIGDLRCQIADLNRVLAEANNEDRELRLRLDNQRTTIKRLQELDDNRRDVIQRFNSENKELKNTIDKMRRDYNEVCAELNRVREYANRYDGSSMRTMNRWL